MNTFKKKSLYLAVAGASALGAGTASAVTLNVDGLGNVLLYPYYTVRESTAGNAYISLLSVVNSTASAKAVKVRFLEGKNSREVLDFNLYLSAKDVWVAGIVATSDGAGIFTPDKSCTDPEVSADPANPVRFVNFAYVASRDDPANDDLDRTREGYVEIIEMGTMYGEGNGGGAYYATHVSGVPRNCGNLRAGGGILADTYTISPSGGLFGSMTLINVGAGLDFAYDATALSQFTSSELWFPPGDERPRLDQVDPISVVVDASPQNNPAAYITLWNASTADPVSAVLMHDAIYNEFVLDAATKSGTDWVVTMPTKTYYYTGVSDKELKVTKLFQRNFKSTGACDDVTIIKYDREERTVKTPGSFSPPPPTVKDSICWEANVITFNSSNVLGSKNVANLTTTFENGWISMAFPEVVYSAGNIPYSSNAHQLGGSVTTVISLLNGSSSVYGAATYYGLPVIGFAAITFNNGDVGGALSNYGGNLNHKGTRDVSFNFLP